MAKEDSKVFDVSKPGDSKPETGSKPMVVGHKLMKDPSVTEPKEEKELKEDQPIAQTSKKTIVPISEQEKESESTEIETKEDETENKQTEGNDEVSGVEEKQESSSEKDENKDEAEDNEVKEKSSEEIKKEKDEAALNNEENLQKIINEKKYFVSIDEASYSSAKTFIKTFLIVGLLAVIILVVLFDLEILDLGIKLPFDLL